MKIIILSIEDMIHIFITVLLITHAAADCPLNSYPRKSLTGTVEAQFNNDPSRQLIFEQSIDIDLSDQSPQCAISVNGFQLNSNQIIDFAINFVPSTNSKKLSFAVNVNNVLNGWRSLKFNYFATANPQFQIQNIAVTEFSTGLVADKYSVYRAIQGFEKFQILPQIKVFISGINLKSKALNSEYTTVLNQYENFKKFSTNTQLITYFSQIVQQKKALSFEITQSKLLGRMLSVNFQTNCQIKGLHLSYVLFSQQSFNKRHNFISGDFELVNAAQHRFTPLSNMDMIFGGINQFKVSRDSFTSVSLNFNNYFSQASFNVETNIPFFAVGYTYIAFEIKQQYVCEDCIKSPFIYQNKFCVEQCPRGYSQTKRLDTSYCDICSMDKLKVIDPVSSLCVCANRHYLDSSEDTCKPCRYDCMSCDSQSRCLTCDNSLLQTKRKLSNNGRCECPVAGFYDDAKAENIVCQKCSPKCLTCDGPRDFDCRTCAAEKQLDFRGFCVCRNGYVQDISGACVCIPPRTLSNGICFDTHINCGPNQQQQFVDLTKRCVCQQGFQQVLNECIKCGSNSIFNTEDLSCKCINNTTKINNECVSCQNNTVYDGITGNCVCKAGTFKSDDGLCITCPAKMAYINGRCECIYNYFEIQTGVCQRCLRETDGIKCKRNLN